MGPAAGKCAQWMKDTPHRWRKSPTVREYTQPVYNSSASNKRKLPKTELLLPRRGLNQYSPINSYSTSEMAPQLTVYNCTENPWFSSKVIRPQKENTQLSTIEDWSHKYLGYQRKIFISLWRSVKKPEMISSERSSSHYEDPWRNLKWSLPQI
jgi:hypothetical protein